MGDELRREPRRRRAAVLVLAAAVLTALAAAGPTVVGAVTDRGDSSEAPAPAGPRPRTGGVPDGWRVESWGDVTWAVPDRWGFGAIDQWCVGGGEEPRPVVQRPHVASTLVACHPSRGLGLLVSVEEPGPPTDPAAYVAGAAVAQRRFGEVVLTVSTRSRALTERVLGTARRFEGLDPNGCPPTADPVDVAAGGDAGAGRTPATGGRLSVCRYALPDRGGEAVLDGSELLSDADSGQAWAALEAAPRGTGPDADPERCGGWPPGQAVLLRTAEAEVAWVHYDGCSGRGVALPGGSRRLTEDVLLWAISPGWSGGWDGSVPMPDRFRR